MQRAKYFVWFLVFFFVNTTYTNAQSNKYYQIAVFFKDKDTSAYPVSNPKTFLSERAITRKKTRGVSVDASDIPVNIKYCEQLSAHGYYVHSVSKWFNCALLYVAQKSTIDSLRLLPFVNEVRWLGMGQLPKPKAISWSVVEHGKSNTKRQNNVYGKGERQAKFCGATGLHAKGLYGTNTLIAVLDAGFSNAHTHSALEKAMQQVVVTYDVLNKDDGVFDDDEHGTAVWSCMAAQDSFEFMGTAPNASYILIRSEDAKTEYPSEEYFWTVAAEFADSCGVDIIHSSLGYNEFDDVFFNHRKEELDGKTAWISKAAQLAINKGMFVVNSAGNEGNNAWKLVAFPADVKQVLTVGSVNENEQLSGFSSIGWKHQQDVKPDVMMLGEEVTVANDWGYLHQGDGTSYAAPILTGALACVWSELKLLSVDSILSLIHYTSSRYNEPTKYWGYGVADINLLHVLLQPYYNDTLLDIRNSGTGYIQVTFYALQQQEMQVTFLDKKGQKIHQQKIDIQQGTHRYSIKLLKRKKRAIHQLVLQTRLQSFQKYIP